MEYSVHSTADFQSTRDEDSQTGKEADNDRWYGCHTCTAKGNKERSVAISEKTAAHLKRYMSIYHAGGCSPDDYLFYTVIKGKVEMPTDAAEKPLWEGDEDEMARLCGLK